MDVSDSSPVRFPSTLWSMVREAGASEREQAGRREALGRLVEHYWKPVYWFLRTSLKRDATTALDLTQSFFLHVLESDFATKATPERGRFRAFLKVSVRNFILTLGSAERAAKRGGDLWRFPLTAEEAETGAPIATGRELSPDERFELEWRSAVIRGATEAVRKRLEGEGRRVHFEVFRRYDLEPENRPTHKELARDLGISEFDVGNFLTVARKAFQDCLRTEVRETVGSPTEAGEELNELFGSA